MAQPRHVALPRAPSAPSRPHGAPCCFLMLGCVCAEPARTDLARWWLGRHECCARSIQECRARPHRPRIHALQHRRRARPVGGPGGGCRAPAIELAPPQQRQQQQQCLGELSTSPRACSSCRRLGRASRARCKSRCSRWRPRSSSRCAQSALATPSLERTEGWVAQDRGRQQQQSQVRESPARGAAGGGVEVPTRQGGGFASAR